MPALRGETRHKIARLAGLASQGRTDPDLAADVAADGLEDDVEHVLTYHAVPMERRARIAARLLADSRPLPP